MKHAAILVGLLLTIGSMSETVAHAATPMYQYHVNTEVNTIDISRIKITYWTPCPSVHNVDESTGTDSIVSDYVLLCNIVAHEYGADYVPVEEKAKVAAVVMNRVHSPIWPNDIYSVLAQENQFENFYPSYVIAGNVTDSVMAAVDLYFANPEAFGNYTSFYGDGVWNYFS